MKYAGVDGVAAYGVLMYVNMVFLAAFIGYSVGTAPVVGYHFGAGNHYELKNLLKKSLLVIGLFSVAMLAAAEALAEPRVSGRRRADFPPDLGDRRDMAFHRRRRVHGSRRNAFVLVGGNVRNTLKVSASPSAILSRFEEKLKNPLDPHAAS